MTIHTLMKVFALLVLASCTTAPASPGCTPPPVRQSIGFTWAPNDKVSMIENNVPSGPFSTALSNWNAGFLPYCNSPTLYSGVVGSSKINMHYAPIAPPTTCPPNAICITRGITDLSNAPFSGGRLSGVSITINTAVTLAAAVTEVIAHEVGHTFDLLDCSYSSICTIGSTVMESNAPVASANSLIGQPGPTPCDTSSIVFVAVDYLCPPPPPPCTGSPVILDLTGKGFDLTSAENGVLFDITGTGKKLQIAWTDASADNAFLALPGSDGLVHTGQELFGNFTPQPPSAHRNGFAALAVYDDPRNGGNGDGIIDSRDAVFASLRLWVDANHDGVSQPEELHTLPSLGVNSISLKYREDDKTDQYGNVFRYRAHLNPDKTTEAGKTAYDVFLVIGQGIAKNRMMPQPHYQTIGLHIRPPIFGYICP
jgi:hypothetical protein